MDLVGWAIVLFALFFLLFFTFTNGFNDASAVVATTIASGAASPRNAVLLAAVTGGLGVLLGGSAVAVTITKLIHVSPDPRGTAVLGAALAGAVTWNLVTWRLGLPSSSSHALVGGLIGAALVSEGPSAVNWGTSWLADPLHQPIGGFAGVLFALLFSPAVGFAAAFVVQRVARVALRNAHFRVNVGLKRFQLVTSALLSYGHGANDAQKTMGLFAFILLAAGLAGDLTIPLWVRVLIMLIMVAGTLGGGWPIMKTLGRRIFQLEPVHALDSQLAAAAVIYGATAAGAPVSTTHVVATGVMGVGAAQRFSAVRWGVAKHILQAWGITIPAAACVGGGLELIVRFGLGI